MIRLSSFAVFLLLIARAGASEAGAFAGAGIVHPGACLRAHARDSSASQTLVSFFPRTVDLRGWRADEERRGVSRFTARRQPRRMLTTRPY